MGAGTLVLLGVLAIGKGWRSARTTLLNGCEVETLAMSVPMVNVDVWSLTNHATLTVCVIGNGGCAIYFAITKVRHDAGHRWFANNQFGEYRWLASFLMLGLFFQASAIYYHRNSYLFTAEIATIAFGIPYAVFAQRRWLRAQARRSLAGN